MRSGQRVGKYVLGEQIARGGMAEVWAARVEGPGGFVKSVALKFILESFAGDNDLEQLFVNEARVAAQLQHANLVTVFDFDQWSDPDSGEAGRYYIAMERIDGQDLRRLLQVARHQGQTLTPTLALHIAGEVLKGLRYVHERRDGSGGRSLGLVHRDVSPHNVLIGMGGEVKLSDFGIAKAMSQSLGTQAGVIRGKLAYSSPEQLRGEAVDHRADQFALGVTLWEMLAGQRLFSGADEMEIVGKVLRSDIPPLAAERSVEPPVEAIVRRMLASRVSDRFPSTAEALAAVTTAPGYSSDAAPLAALMQAVFAPTTAVLPPTLPLKLSDPRGPGGLAETSLLERNPLEGSGPGAGTGQTAPSGSGYVSADVTVIPSWIDEPEEPLPRKRTVWAVGMVVAIALCGGGIVLAHRAKVALSPTSVTPPGAPQDSRGGARPSGAGPSRPAPIGDVRRASVRAAAAPALPPPTNLDPAPAATPRAAPVPEPIATTAPPAVIEAAPRSQSGEEPRRRSQNRRRHRPAATTGRAVESAASPTEPSVGGVPAGAGAMMKSRTPVPTEEDEAANGAPILE